MITPNHHTRGAFTGRPFCRLRKMSKPHANILADYPYRGIATLPDLRDLLLDDIASNPDSIITATASPTSTSSTILTVPQLNIERTYPGVDNELCSFLRDLIKEPWQGPQHLADQLATQAQSRMRATLVDSYIFDGRSVECKSECDGSAECTDKGHEALRMAIRRATDHRYHGLMYRRLHEAVLDTADASAGAGSASTSVRL